MTARAPYRSLRGIFAVAALLAIGAVGVRTSPTPSTAPRRARRRWPASARCSRWTPVTATTRTARPRGRRTPWRSCPATRRTRARSSASSRSTRARSTPATTGSRRSRTPAARSRRRSTPRTPGRSPRAPNSSSTPRPRRAGRRATAWCCTYTAEQGTLSGTLDTAKSLKPEQLTYLKGSNAVYEALWANQSEKDTVEADLPGYKAQAKAVAAALQDHVEGLNGIDGAEVGTLRSTLAKAAGDWEKAARATDADAFLRRLRPGVHRHRPEQVGRRPQGAGPGHHRPGRGGRGLGELTHPRGAGTGRPVPAPLSVGTRSGPCEAGCYAPAGRAAIRARRIPSTPSRNVSVTSPESERHPAAMAPSRSMTKCRPPTRRARRRPAPAGP